MVCTVMEAVLVKPFRLAWQRLLICEKVSTPAARKAFVFIHKSSMKLQQWSLVKVRETYSTGRGVFERLGPFHSWSVHRNFGG
jgi:hypothetical protein